GDVLVEARARRHLERQMTVRDHRLERGPSRVPALLRAARRTARTTAGRALAEAPVALDEGAAEVPADVVLAVEVVDLRPVDAVLARLGAEAELVPAVRRSRRQVGPAGVEAVADAGCITTVLPAGATGLYALVVALEAAVERIVERARRARRART